MTYNEVSCRHVAGDPVFVRMNTNGDMEEVFDDEIIN